jgi:methylmalonyl-CoA epimerase
MVVKELEQSVKQYGQLGLKESNRGIVDAFNVAISMISAGESRLELIQPLGEGNVQNFLEKNGEGLHHIAFAVEDIEKKLSELSEAGVELIDKTPRDGFGGHKIAFIHPKEFSGVLVELVEE